LEFEHKSHLGARGVCEALATILKCAAMSNQAVAEDELWAVMRVAEFDGNREKVGSAGVLQLQEIVKNHTIIEKGCWAVYNTCKLSDNKVKCLESLQVLDGLRVRGALLADR